MTKYSGVIKISTSNLDSESTVLSYSESVKINV